MPYVYYWVVSRRTLRRDCVRPGRRRREDWWLLAAGSLTGAAEALPLLTGTQTHTHSHTPHTLSHTPSRSLPAPRHTHSHTPHTLSHTLPPAPCWHPNTHHTHPLTNLLHTHTLSHTHTKRVTVTHLYIASKLHAKTHIHQTQFLISLTILHALAEDLTRESMCSVH